MEVGIVRFELLHDGIVPLQNVFLVVVFGVEESFQGQNLCGKLALVSLNQRFNRLIDYRQLLIIGKPNR